MEETVDQHVLRPAPDRESPDATPVHSPAGGSTLLDRKFGRDEITVVRHEVTARLDAFPDRAFRGRIASLNPRAEFTPRVALTEDEREDLLFGVRVEFDDASGMLKAGLPLTIDFPAREARP